MASRWKPALSETGPTTVTTIVGFEEEIDPAPVPFQPRKRLRYDDGVAVSVDDETRAERDALHPAAFFRVLLRERVVAALALALLIKKPPQHLVKRRLTEVMALILVFLVRHRRGFAGFERQDQQG